MPAVFGVLLIGFAWPLRRWIGSRAAAAYAVLVLAAPHLVYFSRFIREDLYSLVFTFATILAFQRFLETDRAAWLTASAVAFALAGVTKENAYMTGVLFVVWGVWSLFERASRRGEQRPGLRAAIGDTAGWIQRRLVPLVVAGLVFLSIWALMYTAFGKYPADWLAIPKAIKYWMGQHSIARIPGPWWYYLPQLAYYETAILLAAALRVPARPVEGRSLPADGARRRTGRARLPRRAELHRADAAPRTPLGRRRGGHRDVRRPLPARAGPRSTGSRRSFVSSPTGRSARWRSTGGRARRCPG